MVSVIRNYRANMHWPPGDRAVLSRHRSHSVSLRTGSDPASESHHALCTTASYGAHHGILWCSPACSVPAGCWGQAWVRLQGILRCTVLPLSCFVLMLFSLILCKHSSEPATYVYWRILETGSEREKIWSSSMLFNYWSTVMVAIILHRRVPNFMG